MRLLSRSRDVYFDLAGGNRIPKIGERQARSVAELRSAGVGVSHVLLVHDGTSASSDLFTAALTMLDPEVALTVVHVPSDETSPGESTWLQRDFARAEKLRREVEVSPLPPGDPAEQLVILAGEINCDLLVLGVSEADSSSRQRALDTKLIARKSPCTVCVVMMPGLPQEVEG